MPWTLRHARPSICFLLTNPTHKHIAHHDTNIIMKHLLWKSCARWSIQWDNQNNDNSGSNEREENDQQPTGRPSNSRLFATVLCVSHLILLCTLDLTRQVDRLRTFEHWPANMPSTLPPQLADNGFFYLGDSNRTQCFSCHGVHENWNLGDNIPEVHRRHFPHCRVVQEGMRENLDAASEHSRSGADPARHESTKLSANKASSSRTNTRNQSLSYHSMLQRKSYPGSTGNHFGNQTYPREAARLQHRNKPSQVVEFAPIPNSRHANFLKQLDLRTESERLRTFEHWTSGANPSDLARSGFFYLGNLDRVQCFACSGVLRNWHEGDDANSEHRRHFPNCRFLNSLSKRVEPQNQAAEHVNSISHQDVPYNEPPSASTSATSERNATAGCFNATGNLEPRSISRLVCCTDDIEGSSDNDTENASNPDRNNMLRNSAHHTQSARILGVGGRNYYLSSFHNQNINRQSGLPQSNDPIPRSSATAGGNRGDLELRFGKPVSCSDDLNESDDEDPTETQPAVQRFRARRRRNAHETRRLGSARRAAGGRANHVFLRQSFVNRTRQSGGLLQGRNFVNPPDMECLRRSLLDHVGQLHRTSGSIPLSRRYTWFRDEVRHSVLTPNLDATTHHYNRALYHACHISLAEFERLCARGEMIRSPIFLLALAYLLAHPAVVAGLMANRPQDHWLGTKIAFFRGLLRRLLRDFPELALVVDMCFRILDEAARSLTQ